MSTNTWDVSPHAGGCFHIGCEVGSWVWLSAVGPRRIPQILEKSGVMKKNKIRIVQESLFTAKIFSILALVSLLLVVIGVGALGHYAIVVDTTSAATVFRSLLTPFLVVFGSVSGLFVVWLVWGNLTYHKIGDGSLGESAGEGRLYKEIADAKLREWTEDRLDDK